MPILCWVMSKMKKCLMSRPDPITLSITIVVVVGFVILSGAKNLYANNVLVSPEGFDNITATTMDLKFNVSQENSFSTTTVTTPTENVNDAIWIFVKYSTSGVSGPWDHCTISGISAGDDGAAGITTPSDNKGVFLTPNANKSSFVSNGVTVRWALTSDGLSSTPEAVRFKVFALEMVKVPTGSFYFCNLPAEGERTAAPDLTAIGYPATGDIYVNSATAYLPTGASEGWPNGYSSFYVGKYEVSQQQYADFLNTIDPEGTSADGTYYAAANYNVWEHYIKRDTGAAIGSRYYVTDDRENAACNYPHWDDTRTYLSWSALRPMSEMEFEKAARGGVARAVDVSDYPWGTTAPGGTTETKSLLSYDIYQYYANWYDNAANTQDYDGPYNVGHFLSGLDVNGNALSRTNAQTGASPYGIADLAGSVWEHLINCAFTATPAHGDGDTDFSDENWPTAASGYKGIRGASWGDGAVFLRVSDRLHAGWALATRHSFVGFRPARTP